MPDEPEVTGLLALMLLIDARRDARTDPSGDLVPLAEQDRQLWHRDRIAEGQALVRGCLRRNQPGPYQLQAAINAVHGDAPDAAATDWPQILGCMTSSWRGPRPRWWHSTARSRWRRSMAPARRCRLVDDLDLGRYHLFHAIRADLLRRLGPAGPSGAVVPRGNRGRSEHRRA